MSSFYSIVIVYKGKVWRIDSFQIFGKRKFGELIDQSIGYSSYLDGFSLANHG